MTKQDGRHLSTAAQEERRRTILRMKTNGASEKDIVAATGCSRQAIYPLWNKYTSSRKRDIEKTVKITHGGRKTGERRSLSAAQEKGIQKKIKDKYPDELQFDFALWTRGAVRELIKREYGIDMPVRTVGEYLKRWGYTPQKPVKYAYERKPEAVKAWLETEYPAIKKRAKEEKGDIYWGDETGISTADVRGRGYAPRGKTPTVLRTGKRESVSMISAITNRGKVFWKIHGGSIDSKKFFEFAGRLVKANKKKVFLILDNLRIHKSKELAEWAGKQTKKIELFYLPAYSPDLNPDEHLNADVKYGVGSKAPKKTKEGLAEAAESHMEMLKKTPGRIKKYFKDPKIQYAA